jgi:PTS system maltose and glucose-specific IIC component
MGIKEKTFNLGQKLGKAILLPIAILPVAGLLLGVSAALSNPVIVKTYPALNHVVIQAVFKIMNAAGNGVFSGLPLIFAVGIAVGLAKADKGTAGLASVIGYLIMNCTINALLTITGKIAPKDIDPKLFGQGNILGTVTLQTGIFGGIIIGLMVAYLHNKYYQKKLPTYLAFFGGSRFVPIVTSVAALGAGTVLFFIWPFFGALFASAGILVNKTGILGAFIYGFILRLLLPLGLHHVFYLPFWTTALGGTLEVGGTNVEGFQAVFLAQLGDPDTVKFFGNLAKFNSGRYLHIMIGLPAVCLAMYRSIPDKKRRIATVGFLLSAALTSFITGVTEPIDFALLFASPVLYLVSCVYFALCFVITTVADITIGSTFSAGVIEFFLFGVMQGNAKTGYLYLLLIGIPLFFIYYATFKFMITKFNYKTPGRGDESDDVSMDDMGSGKVTDGKREQAIIDGLGGLENIIDLDNCATRLRVTVKDGNIISEPKLKGTGAVGIIKKGNSVQVVYGPTVNIIKNDLEAYIKSIEI